MSPKSLRASLLLLALAFPATAAAPPWAGVEYTGHAAHVEGVAFSPDARMMATSDDGGTVLVSLFPGPRRFAKLEGDGFTQAAFSPDGEALVAGSDHLVYVWRRPLGEFVRKVSYPGPVLAVTVSRNNVIYAAGGGDFSIHRWILPRLEEIEPLRGHTDEVYVVGVSPNGSMIASGGRDRHIRIWDSSGRVSRALRGRDDSVLGLAFSPDGFWLASSYGDGTVAVWNTQTWRVVALKEGAARSIRDLAVSPNGRWLAGAGIDKSVWVWALTDTGAPMKLAGHRGTVNGIAFSPDGRWLASASSDTSVRIWQVP